MTEIALRDGQSPTYGGSVTGLAGPAGDILTFTAPTVQGRVMKLIRLSVTASATAATTLNMTLVKRSTVDTGGTSVVLLTTPYNPRGPAASTVVTSYTVAPTPGTLIGTAIRSAKFTLALAATGQAVGVEWLFGNRAAEAPSLIGFPVGAILVSQQICLAADTNPAGASYDIDFEFTEDLS